LELGAHLYLQALRTVPLDSFLVIHRLRRPRGNEAVPHPSDVLVFVRWVGVRRSPMTNKSLFLCSS
jgi:hypothetical protein